MPFVQKVMTLFVLADSIPRQHDSYDGSGRVVCAAGGLQPEPTEKLV
jgi:hypothetical protein